ncbi:MAG: hypothetical protein ACRYFX_05485 [Janthinobacterium lividum]
MHNPVRRSRNIGTTRQGAGRDNKLVIPQPCQTAKNFYERLGKYEKIERIINGHSFLFVIEQLREHSKHACSVEALEEVIRQIPVADLGELKFIVLRQPKRKEERMSLVWGRLIYSYDFEGEVYPAILIEAVDYRLKIKWGSKLSLAEQAELEKLRADGHDIIRNGNYFIAEYDIESVRNTQLYRTLPHEFGHYVQYLEVVVRPGNEDESLKVWEARHDKYCRIAQVEKERFAHAYATVVKRKLIHGKNTLACAR